MTRKGSGVRVPHGPPEHQQCGRGSPGSLASRPACPVVRRSGRNALRSTGRTPHVEVTSRAHIVADRWHRPPPSETDDQHMRHKKLFIIPLLIGVALFGGYALAAWTSNATGTGEAKSTTSINSVIA